MKKLNATIQSRLISTAVGITIILITLGLVTNTNLQNTFKQYSLLSRIDNLSMSELELRKYEKDFLLKETSNLQFFKTEESAFLDSMKITLSRVENELNYLKKNEIISDLKLFQKLHLVENGFEEYGKNFDNLRKLIIQKGFKDYGLIGQMRDQIHSVETIVDQQNNLLYSKYMLTLRRHEKDYLLRKDLKYRDKFDRVIELFVGELNKNKSKDAKIIIDYLHNYRNVFHKVIEKDVVIGLEDDRGLMKSINENIAQIEHNLGYIHVQIYEGSKKRISRAGLILFSMITVLSALILVFLYRDSKYIVKSIKNIWKYINRLSKGELPKEIEITGTDEIADMRKAINSLTNNLKQTRDFVIEVGNGNFEEEINVFNGEGELGSNLLNMRKKLLQVSSEREQQAIEAQRRMWNNEGVGLFAELLQKNSHNIEEMSFQIIKNLVKYLKANQGGIFIKDKEVGDEIYYELKAAYAYDRKKFVDKTIKSGEGIIGTCAMEAETIYMTDIPDHYIEITSGLGHANPTSLIIVPLKRDEEVLGIIEIASFNEFKKYEIEFIEKIAENIASHLFFVQMNIKTTQLLEKTQSQAEAMSTQEEEMRQNLEELTVTQERLSTREQELLVEIEQLKIDNKDLFRKLNGTESGVDFESTQFQN
jgi:GAF domain-containing protein